MALLASGSLIPAGTNCQSCGVFHSGQQLTAAIYFYPVQAGIFRETRKVLLLR